MPRKKSPQRAQKTQKKKSPQRAQKTQKKKSPQKAQKTQKKKSPPKTQKSQANKRRAWFFDNDKSNFEGLDEALIKPYMIDESSIKKGGDYCTKEEYKKYLQELDTNARQYAWVERLMSGEQTIGYDPICGLNNSHITETIDALEKGQISKLIFDWDRTLTKFEGFTFDYGCTGFDEWKRRVMQQCISVDKGTSDSRKLPGMPAFQGVSFTVKTMAQWLFGLGKNSKNYEENLHELWYQANYYNIEVWVLTANPLASTDRPSRKIFIDLLKYIGLELPPKRLVFQAIMAQKVN